MFEHKERFESKYQCLLEDECWPWQASLDSMGYGLFRLDGKLLKAHRVSYDLYIGDVPKELKVLHKCDNRSCVNPRHLCLGTQKENMQDMMLKGRRYQSKLNDDSVREIKSLLEQGISQGDIASRFNIDKSNISRISLGQYWSHVK